MYDKFSDIRVFLFYLEVGVIWDDCKFSIDFASDLLRDLKIKEKVLSFS